MSNLISLNVVYDSSGLLTGLNDIDLVCSSSTDNKQISSYIYDISVSPPLRVINPVDSNTILLTRIEDCDGSYYLVSDSYGKVSDAIVYNCEACEFTPVGGDEVDPVFTGSVAYSITQNDIDNWNDAGTNVKEFFDGYTGSIFTITNTPKENTIVNVIENGIVLREGATRDYTRLGSIISLNYGRTNVDIEINYTY